MPLDLATLPTLASTYDAKSPQDILALAFDAYAPSIGIAFSGAEDVVLIDMAVKLTRSFTVFCLDTGRLHPETYQFLEKVRTHYGIVINAVVPQPAAVEQLVRTRGCSRSTRMATASAATSAKSNRSAAHWRPWPPGSAANAATRARARAPPSRSSNPTSTTARPNERW